MAENTDLEKRDDDTYIIDGVELTGKQLNTILQHIQYNDIKSKVERQLVKERFNFDEVLERYLGRLSEITRNTYIPPLERFFKAVPHPLDATTEMVDDYVESLSHNYAPATVRIHVAALSGFYNKLIRWGYVSINPFKNVDLPKMERKRELRVPTEREVGAILRYYKERAESGYKASIRMYVAIQIMVTLGLRVGSIEKLQIKEGKYKTYTKGKWITGDFVPHLKEVVEKFGFNTKDEYPFETLTKSMIQFNLYNDMKALKKQKKIKEMYHGHSFRHYFAVKMYKLHKDIYAVSRLLNHSSIGITQRYLESIGIESL